MAFSFFSKSTKLVTISWVFRICFKLKFNLSFCIDPFVESSSILCDMLIKNPLFLYKVGKDKE